MSTSKSELKLELPSHIPEALEHLAERYGMTVDEVAEEIFSAHLERRSVNLTQGGLDEKE